MEKKEQKPTKVVGLEYSPKQGLPQITLKGAGPMAEEILVRRRKAGRPRVIRDAALTEQLYRLPIDSQIGPELFRAVAIVLAHVLALGSKIKGEARD